MCNTWVNCECWEMVINPFIGIPIIGWITMLHLCFDIYLSIYLSTYQSINQSINIYIYIYTISISISNCIYIYPSIYIFISISSSLSIPISMYLYIYTFFTLGNSNDFRDDVYAAAAQDLLPREAPPGQVTADKLVKTKDLPQDR